MDKNITDKKIPNVSRCICSPCGSVTLYQADCLDVVGSLGNIEAVITDPPYGMAWNTDSTRFTGGANRHKRGMGRSDYGKIEGDSVPFEPDRWLKYEKCVMFGSNHYADKLPVGTTLVWIKKDPHLWGSFLSDAELAWMKGGHGVYTRIKSFPPPVRAMDAGGDPSHPVGIHPTQKPVEIMSWCMEKAKVSAGGMVLDPYMGSGSTGVACIRTGRKFIGIEKDKQHFETASRRIEQELRQGDLFY